MGIVTRYRDKHIMSVIGAVKRAEVHLTLESRAKEALDAYNTDRSTSYKMFYDNDKSKVPSSGGPYVRFTIQYGTIATQEATTGEARQPGLAIVKVHIKKGTRRLLAVDILDTFHDYFDHLRYPNGSLRVTSTTPGVDGKTEGSYWTEKMYIYFDYIKQGKV